MTKEIFIEIYKEVNPGVSDKEAEHEYEAAMEEIDDLMGEMNEVQCKALLTLLKGSVNLRSMIISVPTLVALEVK